MPVSERFDLALATASSLHRDQTREGTDIPYVSHLLGTCSIALEYGANEEQAIAALLHDVLEDVEPIERAREEVAAFGPVVLRIVQACTDTDRRPKPPWRERKEQYVAGLPHEDAAALLVSASDKLHNARAILRDLRTGGQAVWNRFNAGREGQLWYYAALVTAFRSNPEHEPALIDELDRTVREIERQAEVER
jgi:(p)ppGpp synthase/HD superfamily hydrolase